MFAKYTLILILFLLIPIQGIGQNCNDVILHRKVDSLYFLVHGLEDTKAKEYAADLIESMNSKGLQACLQYSIAKLNQARIYNYGRNLEEALILLQDVIDHADKYGHFDVKAFAYVEIALLHEFLKRWPQCLQNLEMAKDLIDKHEVQNVLPQYYVRYSSYLRFQAQNSKAFEMAERAVESALKEDDQQNLNDGYLMLGILSIDFDERIKYFLKIAANHKKNGNYAFGASQYLNVAKIYMRNGDLLKSKEYIDTSFVILSLKEEKDYNYYTSLRVYYESMQRYYEVVNNTKEALHYSKLLVTTIEESQLKVDRASIADAELRFNIRKNKENVDAIEKDRRRLKRLLWLAGGVLLILGLLLYNIYLGRRKIERQGRTIIKRNEALSDANLKNEMLLSEIHHRVKNNLQNIISLIFFKQKSAQDGVPISLDDLTMKIKSIALIHEQLYKEGDFENIHLKEYITSLLDQYVEINIGKKPMTYSVETNNIEFNIETVMPIGLIYTELLSNSIKHNPEIDAIHISLKVEPSGNDEYEFTYSDNGKGFDPKIVANGTGMRLISSFVRQLNGQLEYIDKQDKGFVMKMKFKQKHVSKI